MATTYPIYYSSYCTASFLKIRAIRGASALARAWGDEESTSTSMRYPTNSYRTVSFVAIRVLVLV